MVVMRLIVLDPYVQYPSNADGQLMQDVQLSQIFPDSKVCSSIFYLEVADDRHSLISLPMELETRLWPPSRL